MLGRHALTEGQFMHTGTLGELTRAQAAPASWARWIAAQQSAQLVLQAANKSPVQVGTVATFNSWSSWKSIFADSNQIKRYVCMGAVGAFL